jgi:hypothetical protein
MEDLEEKHEKIEFKNRIKLSLLCIAVIFWIALATVIIYKLLFTDNFL